MRIVLAPETNAETKELTEKMGVGPVGKIIMVLAGLLQYIVNFPYIYVRKWIGKPLKSPGWLSFIVLKPKCFRCLWSADCEGPKPCDKFIPENWEKCVWVDGRWWRKRGFF